MSRPVIVETDRISAGGGDTDLYSLPDVQVEEVRAWCRANGVDPNNTAAVRIEVVDMPLIHTEVYDLDFDGKRFCVPGARQISMHTEDFPLVTAPPDWWHPPALSREPGQDVLGPGTGT